MTELTYTGITAATLFVTFLAVIEAACPPDVCLLYTSDAADDLLCVDLGGRRIIKNKKSTSNQRVRALLLITERRQSASELRRQHMNNLAQ